VCNWHTPNIKTAVTSGVKNKFDMPLDITDFCSIPNILSTFNNYMLGKGYARSLKELHDNESKPLK